MSTVCSKCEEIGPPPKQDDGPTGGDDYFSMSTLKRPVNTEPRAAVPRRCK